MNNILLKNVLHFITVIGLTAFLFLAVFLGIKNGQIKAQTELLVFNFKEVQKGIEFFKQDQGRYPTQFEFSETKIMLNYFSLYPLPEMLNNICLENWQYKIYSPSTVEISVCLPDNLQTFKKGWNVQKISKSN